MTKAIRNTKDMSCNEEDADTYGKILSKRDWVRWRRKGNDNFNKEYNRVKVLLEWRTEERGKQRKRNKGMDKEIKNAEANWNKMLRVKC